MTTTVTTVDGAALLPYTAADYTRSINTLPPQFGQLAAAGRFPIEPIASKYVEVFSDGGVIRALPITEEGRPSTIAAKDKPEGRIFKVPNISHEDSVTADEVRDWLALASRRPDQDASLAGLVNRRLTRLRRKFDITLELMRSGAWTGVIVDGSGAEVLNLYTAFGVTKKVIFFDLGTAGTDVAAKCAEVVAWVAENLLDETMTDVEARVSTSFFNKLISHPKVEKFYLQTAQALNLVNIVRSTDGVYRPREFTFGGLKFVEVPARVPMWGGTIQPLIAADKGHAGPIGTLDSEATYAAPPLDVRAMTGGAPDINSDDDLIHITTEIMKHGMGEEWKGQINALPMFRRPAALVELNAAAS